MSITELITGISAGLFLLIGFIYSLRVVQAWILHRTLRDAMSRDAALAGTMIDRIAVRDGAGSGTGNDDRTGLVLLALGAAIAAFALLAGEEPWLKFCLGGAFFPAFIGAALLLRHYLVRRAAKHDLAGDT
jgi:hypothetical protein